MKRLLISALLLTGCITDEAEAESTLVKSGYTHVQIGDWAWFGCDQKDKHGREFTAVNPNGLKVSGQVCCGVLKGCTVRF
jgi:hypothetical protein